jgi:hypothetical protein
VSSGGELSFGPQPQNRTVELSYLEQLCEQAERLRRLEAYLRALEADPGFACSIGRFEDWPTPSGIIRGRADQA